MPTNLRWPTFASRSQALPHTSKRSLSHTASLVGRDPRFLGESFVAEAARILAGAGIAPIVIPDAAPTPAIAYAVRALKTSGAINFTASHNPPEYNGIKFSTHDGAPALPEVTKQIEAAINANTEGKIPHADPPDGGFETADVKPGFLHRLGELVDLKTIANSHIKVVFDPFWGAGRGYSCHMLARSRRRGRNRPRLPRRALRRPCARARRPPARRLQRKR